MGVLTLLTGMVSLYLALGRRYRAMVFVLVAIGGGMGLSFALKYIFSRPRPDLVPHASHVYTSSFPSGHSMMAAVTFLTLGALLARQVERRRLKAYFILMALLLTVCVGVSRVYVGVHWPTDVLAGWTVGAIWAIACSTLAHQLQRHGEMERPAPDLEEQPDLSAS